MEFEETNPDDLEKSIDRIMAKIHKEQAAAAEVEPAMQAKTEQAEREILMKLWGQLGDSSHNYFTAMNGIHQFIRALKKMRDIKGMPLDVHLCIMEALAGCAQLDLEMCRLIHAAREKHNVNE